MKLLLNYILFIITVVSLTAQKVAGIETYDTRYVFDNFKQTIKIKVN